MNKRTILLIVGTTLTIALAVAAVMLVKAGYKEFDWPPAIMIPVIGILTFFGTLAFTNASSDSADLRKGEMRKAIAASLLSVYFFTLTVTLYANASPVYRLEETTQAAAHAAETPASGEGEDGAAASEGADTASTDETSSAKTPIDLVNTMLDGFNKIIMLVVSFYFGGRAVEEIARTAQGAQNTTPAPERKPESAKPNPPGNA